MKWNQDPRAVEVNTLDYHLDSITWLYQLVSLHPQLLEEEKEHQIEVILMFPWWTGAMWWPQLVELRVKAPIRLPPAEECLKFPKTQSKVLGNLRAQNGWKMKVIRS